jgi:hypothetical protein
MNGVVPPGADKAIPPDSPPSTLAELTPIAARIGSDEVTTRVATMTPYRPAPPFRPGARCRPAAQRCTPRSEPVKRSSPQSGATGMAELIVNRS